MSGIRARNADIKQSRASADGTTRGHPDGSAASANGIYVRVGKRGVDVVVATCLGLMALPLMLVVALVVRARLGAGVLFRQQRVGLDGATFELWKFRTMQADRRDAKVSYDGLDRRHLHKTDRDPRHTTIGRFLRKWSLDELPQFANVIKGDMSLVGPRPELPEIVESKYEPWQHERHRVRPGLTGPWQVSARGEGVMYHSTGVDIEYVHNVSLGTDVKLVLKTVPAILGRSTGS